jgi:hypothetical protein
MGKQKRITLVQKRNSYSTMIESLIKKFDNLSLIDWGVIFYGFKGVPELNDRLDASYIANHAFSKLNSEDEELTTSLVALTSAPLLGTNEVAVILENICTKKNVDLKLSLRKWRFVLLEELLDDLPEDPIYALIEITEFWLSWDNPSDKPHIIQGLDSDLTPHQYYTLDNFKEILRSHRQWMTDEIRKLRNT